MFTKYSVPTEDPTFRDARTRCSTSSGRVAPISIVGTISSSRLSSTVAGKLDPAVLKDTQWKICSEQNPNNATPSSAAPNNAIVRPGNLADTHPPTRLPSPNPSMNALTTTATDSAFTP